MAQFIDKSAVVAEIQRRIDLLKSNQNPGGPVFCFARETVIEEYKNILSFLDTLEMKEVDLVKEYDNNFSNDPVYSKLVNRNAGIGIARYFFNLGLKTQKSESKKESETNCPNFDEAQGTSFVK